MSGMIPEVNTSGGAPLTGVPDAIVGEMSQDQAEFAGILENCIKCFQQERKGSWEVIEANYFLGLEIIKVIDNKKYGDSAVKKLAMDIHAKTGRPVRQASLYEAAKVARTYETLDRIRELNDTNSFLTWTFLLNNCTPHIIDKNTAGVSPGELDAHWDKKLSKIERVGKQLDEINKINEGIASGDIDLPDSIKDRIRDTTASVENIVPQVKVSRIRTIIAQMHRSVSQMGAVDFDEITAKERKSLATDIASLIDKLHTQAERMVTPNAPAGDAGPDASAGDSETGVAGAGTGDGELEEVGAGEPLTD